jgi:hypothetical protein
MQPTSKIRVIKDFDKLDKALQEQINEMYPNGFSDIAEDLISYTDPKTGMERFALPLETEDRYYMVRMDQFIESQIDNSDDDDLSNLNLDKIEQPEELKDELNEEVDDDVVDDIAIDDEEDDDEDEGDEEDDEI